MPDLSDAASASVDAWLLRYRATGDPEALSAFFDATAARLFRVAVHVSGDAAAAEDAVQETFLAVIETAQGFAPGRPSWPWLVGILRRKLADARRRGRRAIDPARLRQDALLDDAAANAERREDVERVRAALERLPEPYRAVALLRWRYGLEPAEIAHVRGEPPGTVRSILSRAAGRLRRVLGGLAALTPLGRPHRGLDAVRRAVFTKAFGAAAAGAGGLAMTKGTIAALALVAGLAAGVALDRAVRPEAPASGVAAPPVAVVAQTGAPVRRERVRAEPPADDAAASPTAEKAAAPKPEPTARDDAVRAEALGILAGLDGNPKTAAAAGARLAKLDPRVVIAALRERWKDVPDASDRLQLLKAFAFGAPNPVVLDVLDLGMTDAAPAVQNWAERYLRGWAGRDFASDWTSYAAWREKTAGSDSAAVARGTAAELAERLRAASPGEIGGLAALVAELRARPEDMRQAGLPEAVEPWIARTSSNTLGCLLNALVAARPDDDVLRRIFVPLFASEDPERRIPAYSAMMIGAGSGRNAWAVDPIAAHLRDADPAAVRDAARALGWIGDPRAIHPLFESLRRVGDSEVVNSANDALSRITGVRYDVSHDAAWWDAWWAKNQERFGAPR
jgi:RNA polymerase sigma-70 factor (ECF subfamily)